MERSMRWARGKRDDRTARSWSIPHNVYYDDTTV